ncbi:MAG: dTDP-4-dehydrorhamnose 3,5-epimerase family protein [Deltaproteobacteria bacterium]|nr:dTDP-4-dehydrorhamnose 3,5-epimerase family protein [Deltaproteobacteria bacterium]
MMAGIQIKALKLLLDDRGFLMELLRSDDPIFEVFGQIYISGCKPGVVKAWHYHKKQTDHFVCVLGKALVVLYDMREYSPSKGATEEFILEAPPCRDYTPILLKVPPFVAHGFTAIDGEESRLINIPTLPYQQSAPDEYRLPWNSQEVPYTWPKNITRGG